MTIDYRAFPVLYVDDEVPNLVALRYALQDDFELLTAASGPEALEILRDKDVAVLLCDQRMPDMSGVEVCERASEIRPDAVRIIITAYADLHACIDAVNRGKITRYLPKPIRNEELTEVLRTSIGFVHLQRSVRDFEVRMLRSSQVTSTFHAEMGHELNNLVTVLIESVEHIGDLTSGIRQNVPTDVDRVNALLAEMDAVLRDTSTVVDRLNGVVGWMSRGGSSVDDLVQPRSEAARVVEATTQILRSHIQQVAGLEVRIEAEPTVPMGRVELGQAVMNLLLNAAEVVADPATDRVTARVALEGDHCVIEISDTGPGIPEHLAQRVFDARFTTKERGRGLGLSVVRRLVETAGGSVEARRLDPTGTMFRLTLPVLLSSGRPP